MTKAQALKQFKETHAELLKSGDKVAIRTAWNDYTDMLCKNGDITEKQYDTWTSPFQ
jgi:hypothetical protein